jgi:hypothetical protein
MKILFSKIIPCLLFTILLTQQTKAQRAEPLKLDKVIYIVTDSLEDFNMKDFGDHLISKGYMLENISDKFKSFSTSEKTTAGGYKHKLNVSFKGNKIIIRPTCNLLMLGSTVGNYQQTWVEWEYHSSKSNLFYKHYMAFISAILSYEEPVFYDAN